MIKSVLISPGHSIMKHLAAILIASCLIALPQALLARDVDHAMTGAWFDPGHRGEGFLVEILDQNSALVYWFSYDRAGNQRWFVGQGSVASDTIVIDHLLAGSGATFGEDFDPDEVIFSDAGLLTIQWGDCNNAEAQFIVDGTGGNQSLQRLTTVAGRECGSAAPEENPQTGSWYDITHQGEGLVIEALPGNQALVFWFSYHSSGKPAWFYGSGDLVQDDIVINEMYTTSGGHFGDDFDPEEVVIEPWGSLLAGLGCDFGKMDYSADSPDYGTGKQTLVRLTNPGQVACDEPRPPNILLVIADDVGKDSSSQYEVSDDLPDTPVLDALAAQGLVLENAWSNPTCSPTRAGILTGKYGFRTGVLDPEDILATTETSLHDYINTHLPGKYADAVIGKWHLGSMRNSPDHPAELGVSHYSGILGGGVDDYENWVLTTNGEQQAQSEYTTSKLIDEAVDWLAEQDKPWFLWLAFNAPHTPFHLPPENLHQRDLSGSSQDISSNPRPYYLAAIEALDTELGRLLASMDAATRENTLIIFLGDNGTPGQVAQAPYSRRKAKGSLYQGGVNIPFFVTGPGVPRQGERESALVNTTDLFATIADIAGVNVDHINDSNSFKGLLNGTSELDRTSHYTELDGDSGWAWTISDGHFKLIESGGDAQELYDLLQDPYETEELLTTGTAPAGVVESLTDLADQIHTD
jgi:arylsulfatase A-like enzyme